jgi:hypothetical protein
MSSCACEPQAGRVREQLIQQVRALGEGMLDMAGMTFEIRPPPIEDPLLTFMGKKAFMMHRRGLFTYRLQEGFSVSLANTTPVPRGINKVRVSWVHLGVGTCSVGWGSCASRASS